MKGFTQKLSWITVSIIIAILAVTPARADDYPGVYTSDDSLVFVQSSDEFGGLQGIVILSYEYSMDWVITVGMLGAKTETGMLLTDGHQYVYNADGTKRSEMEFSTLDRVISWDEMTFQLLPSYGNYLAPMVQGGLAYALVQMQDGLPGQLVLAAEALNNGTTLNLFEGFVYQISNGELTTQIAFTEIAFGSQGLVVGDFPDDFPPPPEDYPNPYPDYTMPGYVPQDGGSTSSTVGTNSQYFDPMLPQGTEITSDEASDQPRFTLEPMHDYDVPPLRRIGVLEVRSYADLEGYGSLANENLEDRLTEIEGVEVVYIPYDSLLFGGAVMYDRAVWLCEQYGVDSLLITELYQYEIPGGAQASLNVGTVRVLGDLRSKLIEGTGGAKIWDGRFETNLIHEGYEVSDGVEDVLRIDLYHMVNDLVSDIINQGVLEGSHID